MNHAKSARQRPKRNQTKNGSTAPNRRGSTPHLVGLHLLTIAIPLLKNELGRTRSHADARPTRNGTRFLRMVVGTWEMTEVHSWSFQNLSRLASIFLSRCACYASNWHAPPSPNRPHPFGSSSCPRCRRPMAIELGQTHLPVSYTHLTLPTKLEV